MDSISMEKKKPFGAVRPELFRMLTDPGEAPPTSYDEESPGSTYARSLTRNPISLDWPKPSAPMPRDRLRALGAPARPDRALKE